MKDHQAFYAQANDAREYQYKIIVFTVSLYVVFVAYVAGSLNLWWMVFISSVLVTRWMIAFHELFHLKKAEQLDWLTRLVPIPFAPINLGYREYRNIHMGHHQYTASKNDPDAFHILDGPFKALLGALTQHEQASYRYIRKHGLNKELALMILVRLSIFVLLSIFFTTSFLLWFAVLRITYTINDFVFFHVVHFRSGKAGTFALTLPGFLKYLLILIYGKDVVYATMHHDIHHQQPRIAAKYLPDIAG